MKKSPTFEKKNFFSVYVREEDKDTFEQFEYLINKDKALSSVRTSKKMGLRSIAIMQLILKYVETNKDKLQSMYRSEVQFEGDDNETDKTMDKETTGN